MANDYLLKKLTHVSKVWYFNKKIEVNSRVNVSTNGDLSCLLDRSKEI